MTTIAEAIAPAAKLDIRDRLAAEMDAALGKPAKPAATPVAVTEAATPAATPRKRAPRKPKPEAAAPVEVIPTTEEQEQALKAAWDSSTAGEAHAKTVMDAAKIGWENTRVLKCRVAFKTAEFVGFKADGTPNLLAIARILGTESELTPGERTKKAKSRKNSFRLYVAAGMALEAEGMVHSITEPTADERSVVRDVFSAKNDAPADAPKGEGEGSGEGESESDGSIDPVALGVVDILGHIARMEAAFKLIVSSEKVISEREAANVADMLATFTAKLTEYADGK